MWLKIRLCFLILLKGGTNEMVAVYVALIIAGRRTYAQVPATLKAKVAEELTALDLADLIVD
ncbi:MAG: hypothetical protein IKB72_01305 [Ruminococcus sp.]|nr:hypothetical protein [Ruminococcus sp.]